MVALGSNVGDSPKILAEALLRLEKFSGAPLLKASLWRTSPVDCPPDSPAFINTVAILTPLPQETPESLLSKLLNLEREFGRKPKSVLNEPRPLDLDLILFGNKVRGSKHLILPHPRAHLRKFVLQPLSEIAPDLIFPGGRSVIAMLAALPVDQNVTPI